MGVFATTVSTPQLTTLALPILCLRRDPPQISSPLVRLIARPSSDWPNSKIWRASNKRDPEIGEGDEHCDGFVHPGEVLSAHVVGCRSWRNPIALLSVNVTEACLLHPNSLAISRNNEHAAVALTERDGNQHHSCHRVHFSSIKERRYLRLHDEGQSGNHGSLLTILTMLLGITAFSLASTIITHN